MSPENVREPTGKTRVIGERNEVVAVFPISTEFNWLGARRGERLRNTVRGMHRKRLTMQQGQTESWNGASQSHTRSLR